MFLKTPVVPSLWEILEVSQYLCGLSLVTCWISMAILFFFFFKILFIYFKRGGKGRRKRGRETLMCGCLSHALNWGPGPQPRHVPWLGIKLMTLWSLGWHSIHWATPARAIFVLPSVCTLLSLHRITTQNLPHHKALPTQGLCEQHVLP